jgi:hypothetical protein
MVLLYVLFAALAGSAVYLGQKLSPKMLVYRLRVRPLPTLAKSKTGTFQLAVSSHVELYNENLLHIDIHAIIFDFYTRNQQDQMRHLGSVFDTFQLANDRPDTVHHHNHNGSTIDTLAMWPLPAQSHFSTRTKLVVSLRPWRALSSTWRLMKQLLRHGYLEMPTTGVAHIRVAAAQNYSALSFTISISCENRVHLGIRGLDILGRDCAMKQVAPGWLDLLQSAEELRNASIAKTIIA